MRFKMQTDLVGMEHIAYEYEERPISGLPAGTGSMPGKPAHYKEEEGETELISGRGLIP